MHFQRIPETSLPLRLRMDNTMDLYISHTMRRCGSGQNILVIHSNRAPETSPGLAANSPGTTMLDTNLYPWILLERPTKY